MKYFYLADGCLAPTFGKHSKSDIKKLQLKEIVRKHGGICRVVEYSEPRAEFFLYKENKVIIITD